jgi:hypothetical protein
MSIKTKVQLQTETDAVIVVNGNREITPPLDRALRTNIIDSMLNIADGGMVIQALTGYATELIPSNNKHLTPKKYVDDKDALVVHLAGTETITGAKTFSLDIIPANTKGLAWASGSSIADTAGVINIDGDENVYITSGAGFEIGITSGNGIVLTSNDNATINLDSAGSIDLNSTTSVTLNAITSVNILYGTTISIGGNDLTAELGYLNGVTSAIQTQIDGKVTSGGALGTPSSGTLTNCTGLPKSGVTGYQGYSLMGISALNSPADATTYYYGVLANAIQTTEGNSKLVISKAGTVTRIDLISTNTGTLGSNETSTVSFRLNATTDTTITSALVTNTTLSTYAATGLSTVVAAGDTFEIKWVTPTWATNPTNLRFTVLIYIE